MSGDDNQKVNRKLILKCQLMMVTLKVRKGAIMRIDLRNPDLKMKLTSLKLL